MSAPADDAPPIEHALYAASLGIRVAPLVPGGKRGLVKWKREATTDEATLRRWWMRWPDANVALIMGVSGDGSRRFVGGDFDHKDGTRPGLASYDLLDSLYDIGATLTVESATGGRHAIHSLPVEAPPLHNFVDGLPDYPSVDLRGDGGLLIGPGSVVNGRRYRWLNDVPILPVPEDIHALYRSASKRRVEAPSREPAGELDTSSAVERAVRYLKEDAPEAVQGANGDTTTYRVACRLRDFGLSESVAFDLLDEHWNHPETGGKAFPEWDTDQLADKVASAYRSATGAWGGSLPENEFDSIPPSSAVLRGTLTDFGRRVPFVPGEDLVRDTIPAVGVGFLGGQSGALKTFVAVTFCGSVARGVPFAGRKIESPGAALYVAFEGQGTLAGRVEAYRSKLEDPDADFPVMMLSDFGSLSSKEDRETFAKVVAQFRDYAKARWGCPLRALVIDTVVAAGLIPEDKENDPAAWQKVFDFFQAVARRFQIAIVLVHHYGKTATAGLRGSSNARAGADFILAAVCDRDELTGETSNHFLSLPKTRNGPEGPIGAIVKEQVEIGKRADGSNVTSLVLAFDTDRKPAKQKRALSKAAAAFVLAATEAMEASGESMTIGGQKVRAVRKEIVRGAFVAHYGGEGDTQRSADAVRKQFGNATKKLPQGWRMHESGSEEWFYEVPFEGSEFDAEDEDLAA